MPEPSDSTRIPITIEVTPEQKKHLEQLAEAKGLSQEAVVLAALDRELNQEANGDVAEERSQPESFLDGIEHLVGSVEGPSDLSTNPDHVEGYGRS